MALKGEQFQNTYMPGRPDWLSPEHHTNQGPAHLTKLHKVGDGLTESHRDTGITTFDVEDKTGHLQVSNEGQEVVDHARALKRADREDNGITGISMNDYLSTAVDEVSGTNTNRQGMLFDPYTGTGLPRDPTVSKEQRLAAVTRQLDLRGKGAPQLHETYAVGDTPVSEFDRPIRRSPHGERAGSSTMKAAEFYEGDGDERLVADRPKVKQGRGQRGGGLYQTSTNTASVNKLYYNQTADYPTRSLNRPTKDATSTGTAWNPDWYTGGITGKGKGIMPKGSKDPEEYGGGEITGEILKHSFHNPETGETLNPHTGPNEPVSLPWEDETPEQVAANRRQRANQMYVDKPSAPGDTAWPGVGRKPVTGTSGSPDDYQHLGRFHPGLDTTYVQSWDKASALKQLHEAGFQSELHKGTGHTGDQSLLPPGVESEAQKANTDRPKNWTSQSDIPTKEYHPTEEGSRNPKPVMLPTPEAEGFMTQKVYGGEKYNANYDHATRVDFHKRRNPSETETVERQSKQITEWPDPSTAFHEREHAIDPNIGLRTVNRGSTSDAQNDPVNEGIADAATDRTIEYANVHEDGLNPSLNPSRFLEVEDRKRARGYGTKNTAWKTDQDRAIYAATRIHSAMADEPNIPDRVDLVKEQFGLRGFNASDDEHPVRVTQQRTASGRTIPVTEKSSNTSGDLNIHSERNTDKANNTLLGKLYHENEHVRDGLRDLGLGRIGMQAAEKHASRMSDAALVAEEAKPDETQLSFWPREGVNE